MQKRLLSICFLLFCISQSFGQTNPQVMMQGWYWDYPKTGQGAYNWSDTLRLKAASLGQAGFTHVWYPPFAGNGNKSGGYDPRDLFVGPSQTSLGTLAEMTTMVNSFTANGITPVADMVYNHRDAGRPENNPAVKEYMLNFAGANNGSCQFGDNNTTQTTTYKQPFPSDRVRMVIPVGGSTGLGAGNYYININSRSSGYVGKRYLLYITTNRAGGGQAWDFANGCSTKPTATSINAPNGTYAASLKQGYWVEMNNNQTEFNLNLQNTDFHAAGDSIFIQAVNLCGDYTDHRIWKIWYGPGGYDIANQGAQNGANYKLSFQTYSDFSGMPSGRGGLNWTAFRPNWNGQNVSNIGSYHNASRGGYGFGGASGTCLGPQWSQQSLDYFYDYDHSQSSGRDTLMAWTRWTYDRLASKGLRVDAVKHFDPQFMADMLNNLYTTGRTPDLVVGEWYGENRNELKGWIDNVTTNLNALNPAASSAIKLKIFDFSMRRALKDALDNGTDPRNAYFNSLRFNSSVNLPGFNIVTFLNNHDFRGSTVANGDALVHNNPDLGYAWLLTNNQLGIPTVFYPDYYGYPARNTTYGPDQISFDYHPIGLLPLKTKIDNLIKVHKKFITGSTGMDLLNNFGGSTAQSGLNATVYHESNPGKVLIYQLRPGGTLGTKEVIVAINFDSQKLRVDHLTKLPLPNGIAVGTRFGDVLGRSNFPFAVVDNDSRIYMELPPKSYSVWVQDYVPLSVTLASTTACTGQSNTLTASITGGTGPFTYSFSAGATAIPGSTSLASVTAAGPYSVTVTDDFGVSVTAIVNSTFNALPTATLLPASSTITCAVPTVSLTASTGTSYTLSNGQTNTTDGVFSLSGAGSYSVVVSNASGCTASATATVASQTVAPTVSLMSAATGICGVSGQSTTLSFSVTGGTPLMGQRQGPTIFDPLMGPMPGGSVSYNFYNIQYSNGTPAGQADAGVSTAWPVSLTTGSNVFSLTVTDAGGCTGTQSVMVTLFAPPTPTLTASNGGTLNCAQTTVTLTAGGGTSYAFAGTGLTSSDAMAGTAVANAEGTYSVTVTNASGCTSVTTTAVVSNTTAPTLTVLPTSGTLTCANPSLTLTASGNGTGYNWTGGSTGTSLTVNAGGIYSVTATAANGCSSTSSVTVSQDTNLPVAGLAVSGTLTCTNPSATLTASGGDSYVFSGPSGAVSGSGNSRTINESGTYSVTVINTITGCTNTTTATVSSDTAAPGSASLTTSNSGTLTCAAPLVTLTASATGTGLTYVFTGPSGSLASSNSSNVRSVSASGTYNVTITSGNGCTASATTTVESNTTAPTLTVSPTSGTLTCTNPSLTLTATGDATSYVWTGGVTSNTLAVTTGGSYSITATAANGCTSTSSITVSQDTNLPVAGLAVSGTLTCVNLSATLTASGGDSYVFSGPSGAVSGSGNSRTVNESGTYSVTVTNTITGCSSVSTATVSSDTAAPGSPALSASNSGTLTCSATSLTLTASATGSSLTYAFAGPLGALAGSGNTRTVSTLGTYSVTIASGNGCTATATTTVSSNTTAPALSIAPASPMLTCASPTQTLTATSAGSTFRWNDNSTGATLVVSTSGTYSVTATSANGCSSTTSVAVASNFAGAVPVPTMSSSGTTVCVGTNVVITASVSGPASSYQWFRNGQIVGGGSATLVVSTVQTMQAGNYVLVVTGGCGSATTTAYTLAVNPEPTVVITFPSSATVQPNGGAPIITMPRGGGLSYQVSGGVSYGRQIVFERFNGYEFRQVNDNTNGIFPIDRPGPYTITVTGANGCQRRVQGTVVQAP